MAIQNFSPELVGDPAQQRVNEQLRVIVMQIQAENKLLKKQLGEIIKKLNEGG
jgi:hypothetical protein